MNLIRGPTRNETFRIGDADRRILNHVALDTTVISVTVRRVATARKVDRNHTVTTENVRTESRRTGRLIVARLSDEVRLEEVHTGARKFENFREIGRRKLFHPHQTFRRVLQNVDRAVVAGIIDRIAPSKWVNDSGETLFAFDEGLDGTAGERLDRRTDRTDAQRGVRRAGRCRQLDRDRAINGAGAVNRVADQVRQRLTEAVRHFTGNVAEGVVDRRGEGQRGERSIIRFV